MKNYNPSITEALNRTFDLKGENTAEVADYIQPVKEIQPRINICKAGNATNATSATIYTTPSDKDFYLTNILLSVSKDATATSDAAQVTAFVDGAAVSICRINSTTLTAQLDTIAVQFPLGGLKIDRNTIIAVTNSTNVANVKASAQIQGYTQETTKGV